MQKLYKTPAVYFVILDDADIITMSNDDQKSLDVTDTNTDFSDKAPTRTLWGDEWYPFFDIYFASPICQICVNIGWKTLETFDFRAFLFAMPQIHRNFAPQKQRILVPEADQRNYLII